MSYNDVPAKICLHIARNVFFDGLSCTRMVQFTPAVDSAGTLLRTAADVCQSWLPIWQQSRAHPIRKLPARPFVHMYVTPGRTHTLSRMTKRTQPQRCYPQRFTSSQRSTQGLVFDSKISSRFDFWFVCREVWRGFGHRYSCAFRTL